MKPKNDQDSETQNTVNPNTVNSDTLVFDGITSQQVGSFLKEKRLEVGMKHGFEKGYKQSDVAEAIGLKNVNYMTFFENGQTDVRRSKYLGGFIKFYGITPDEVRTRLGMHSVQLTGEYDAPLEIPATVLGSSKPDSSVMIQHLGTVQAHMTLTALPKTGQLQKHQLVECPLAVARRYDPANLFVLTVDGDSMTCTDVQKTIPAGAKVLFHKHPELEPRAKDIVVAFIPSLGANGLGVLKVFRKGLKDEIVLESYNPNGARYPAQQYPEMIVQGVCLGFWVEMR